MQDKPYKSVLIVGCGYIGQRVARLLQATGCNVTGSVRSEASRTVLQEAGIDARLLDLDRPASGQDAVSGYDAVLYLAPPQAEGDRDQRMQMFLQLLDSGMPPRRMVYLSTSAVYGDCRGAWITESQPVSPATARGHRRLDAEQQVRLWCGANTVQWILLRVPGIYGPGKLPLARLRKGTPVLSEAESPYTNRIHADDLAAICVAALFSPHANEIYNVSDGHPSNMTDYFFRVADAAGLPRPPVVDRNEAGRVFTRGMLSFLNDSRRMRNDKLLDVLGVSLTYPDLEAGLKSCFRD